MTKENCMLKASKKLDKTVCKSSERNQAKTMQGKQQGSSKNECMKGRKEPGKQSDKKSSKDL